MGVVDAVHTSGSDLLSFTLLSPQLSLNVNLSCAEDRWTELGETSRGLSGQGRLCLKDFRACEL